MVSRLISISFLFSTSIGTAVSAEVDFQNGKTLARTNCAHCHGFDGNARSTKFQPVPMLAGQPAVYLVQEMQNYISGNRKDASKGGAMTRKLKTLSQQDMEDVAVHYEAQKRY